MSWTEQRTNASIFREIRVSIGLSTACLKRLLDYFGHIARKIGDNLEILMAIGFVEGNRARGCSPTRWPDMIQDTLTIRVHDVIEAVRDRSA